MMRVLLVVEPDASSDRDDADRLARRLRSEIAELDVESVAPAGGLFRTVRKAAMRWRWARSSWR
jgi:hypothetical protein